MCGSLGGSDTGFTVSARFVGETEFSEIATDHVELDFHIVEAFAIVDCDVVANHFWHDDSVSEVSLNGNWLLSWLCVLL